MDCHVLLWTHRAVDHLHFRLSDRHGPYRQAFVKDPGEEPFLAACSLRLIRRMAFHRHGGKYCSLAGEDPVGKVRDFGRDLEHFDSSGCRRVDASGASGYEKRNLTTPIAWAYFGIYNFLGSPEGFDGAYTMLQNIALLGMALLIGLAAIQFYKNKYRIMPKSSESIV